MRTTSNSELLKDLRVLFDVGTVAGLSDGRLLDRFVARSDEAGEVAFSALVERHGPMVWRVCRGVLADAHAAEDAFQATFLVLVRRVHSIRKRESVASWLRGVAYRISSRALRASARRRRHERAVAEVREESSQSREDDLAAILHEELDRLPERFREALTLCDLQGHTHEEAALLLGVPAGTIKSRLSRGRDRLRERLIRRGVAPAIAAGSLATTTSASAAGALPESLVVQTVHAACRFLGDPAPIAAISAAVVAMIEDWSWSMTLMKIKSLAILTLVSGTLALGAGTGPFRSPARAQGPVAKGEAPRPRTSPGVPVKSIPLISPNRPQYLKFIVPDGLRVARGDIVAEFHVEMNQHHKDSLESAAAKAEIKLTECKESLEQLNLELKEYQFGIAEVEMVSHKADLKVAEAELTLATREHEEAVEAAKTSKIKSPITPDATSTLAKANLGVVRARANLEKMASKSRLIDSSHAGATRKLRGDITKARSELRLAELAVKQAVGELERFRSADGSGVVRAPIGGTVRVQISRPFGSNAMGEEVVFPNSIYALLIPDEPK